jgi:AcrR family transcriptional regulator
MPGRREEIEAAAFSLAAAEGLEAVHARTVAGRLGIHHATIHYYYPRRGDLIEALAVHALARMNADRARLLEEGAGPSEKLEACIAMAEAYSRRESPMGRVWIALLAAEPGISELKARLEALSQAWSQDHAEAASAFPDGSLFQDPMLLGAALFGAVFAGQISGADTSAMLDRIYDSIES